MAIRTLLFSAAAIFSLSVASCTKDYTCQCTISYSGAPGLPDTVVRAYTIRDKKTEAQNLCRANSSTSTNSGITTDESCELF